MMKMQLPHTMMHDVLHAGMAFTMDCADVTLPTMLPQTVMHDVLLTASCLAATSEA